MKTQSARLRLVASTIFFGAGLALSGQAFAQDASGNEVGEVVVTGSRIPLTNVDSPSPISTIGAGDIAKTNAFSVGDVLTRIAGPDYTSGISSATTNGGVGLSEVGLRNLGPTRTLVLIDGQRLVPIFSGSSSVPDLNSVPLAMIDRIEVLRDGASSIYGADAIGGVINIITKRSFSGLQVDAGIGGDQHGGGNNYNLNATWGFNSDKGNLTVSYVHEDRSPVQQADRTWAQNPYIGTAIEGGSAYRSQLNILQDAVNGSTVWSNTVAGGETTIHNSALGSLPCLTFLPNLNRVKLNAGCPAIDPGTTLVGGLRRDQVSFNSHYDLTDRIRFVASGFFTDRHSEQRIRPEPLLGASIASTSPATGLPVYGGFEIPELAYFHFSDPLGIASASPCSGNAAINCLQAYYTPNEFGPRDYKQTSETYRFRAGLEGSFGKDFKWEAGYVGQRNDTTERIYNSGNWYHLAQATGQMPCVDVPGGCVASALFGYNIPAAPFNFFQGVNSLTPAQVKYLTFTMTDTNYAYEDYAYADINGTVFDLPAGPLKFALGAERRFEFLSDNPDSLQQEGYAANPSAATQGGYNVSSGYVELRVPLLSNVPFVQDLVFSPSYRYDHYSNFGDASTYKLAATWDIIPSLRLRGGYSTGFRAPSTAELFGGNQISYVTVDGDPCDTRQGVNGNSLAGTGSLATGSACYNQLKALGLSDPQIAAYQSPQNNLSTDQRGLILGGNPNLQPEKSRQFNVGVVFTPTFLPGFSADADYYQIKVSNSIVTGGIPNNFGPDLVVSGCYSGTTPAFCNLITRNASGIFQISSQNTNFGLTTASGVDLEVSYDTGRANLKLPFPGNIHASLQAERQFKDTAEQPDGTVADNNGKFKYSDESVHPKWKGRLSLDYTLDKLNLHYDAQYIGHAFDFDNPASRAFGDYIPNYFYSNISVSYQLPGIYTVKEPFVTVGINNLFDKKPPILGADSICKCNSFAGPYDFDGRAFFGRLSAKF